MEQGRTFTSFWGSKREWERAADLLDEKNEKRLATTIRKGMERQKLRAWREEGYYPGWDSRFNKSNPNWEPQGFHLRFRDGSIPKIQEVAKVLSEVKA
jgi:hypothetical protein